MCARGASGVGERGSGHFGQRSLDMVGRREFRTGECGGDQGVVGQQIDLARQTGGGLEERFFGGGLEEREFRAGESQPMRQIAGEFVAGERGHVVTDDDPLRKRLMDGHRQAAAQFWMAEQEETEAVLGIHLVIGEEPQILEDIRAEVVGFVDKC